MPATSSSRGSRLRRRRVEPQERPHLLPVPPITRITYVRAHTPVPRFLGKQGCCLAGALWSVVLCCVVLVLIPSWPVLPCLMSLLITQIGVFCFLAGATLPPALLGVRALLAQRQHPAHLHRSHALRHPRRPHAALLGGPRMPLNLLHRRLRHVSPGFAVLEETDLPKGFTVAGAPYFHSSLCSTWSYPGYNINIVFSSPFFWFNVYMLASVNILLLMQGDWEVSIFFSLNKLIIGLYSGPFQICEIFRKQWNALASHRLQYSWEYLD
jgi:hypothetical protein